MSKSAISAGNTERKRAFLNTALSRKICAISRRIAISVIMPLIKDEDSYAIRIYEIVGE